MTVCGNETKMLGNVVAFTYVHIVRHKSRVYIIIHNVMIKSLFTAAKKEFVNLNEIRERFRTQQATGNKFLPQNTS